MMKKFILIVAVLFAMFALSATPKFTMLDYNCGNTPEYTAKFVKLDTTKKIAQEHINYICSLRSGTWLIEFEDGQTVYCSLYKGNIIAGGYVQHFLINYGKEEN